MKTIKIENIDYKITDLKKLPIAWYINEELNTYFEFQNCWPSAWIIEKEGWTNLEKAIFIYHAISDSRYIL